MRYLSPLTSPMWRRKAKPSSFWFGYGPRSDHRRQIVHGGDRVRLLLFMVAPITVSSTRFVIGIDSLVSIDSLTARLTLGDLAVDRGFVARP